MVFHRFLKENILYNHYSLHGTDFTGNTETQPLYRTKEEDKGKNLTQHCSKDSKERLNGFACSAWVIYNGNMNYLKKSISWAK